jgi:aspartate racemase
MPRQAVIGLIGGMSWKSTVEYYRLINEEVLARLGGVHSARVLLWSVDFGEVARLRHEGTWNQLGEQMADGARRLERGGADFVVICANTMHKLADAVEAAVSIPLIHVADVAAERVKARGWSKVGLIGTAFTMEQDFYRQRLADRQGIETLIPEAEDRHTLHRIIFDELVIGKVLPESREACLAVIGRLAERGAQSVLLACTEFMLMLKDGDGVVPLLDTTALHAQAAVDRALVQLG